MVRDSRYDILFEPVKIGPVTARNRFYQVPHCNGFGWRQPNSLAAMRGIKAEGGWAVVSTEEVEIHPSSD
ncbi:MAG: NADH:flavin oxidoreductase, partial [Alphaproteobacteria bacterium]|nr:NADH:flavin oxidoreductase [Alphaproteobacteria bacterium]